LKNTSPRPLGAEQNSSRNAIYKTLVDARRKLRASLIANGYLAILRGFVNGWQALDRLPRTDPRDAGCDETMELLHVYAELVAIDRAQVDRRYPEVAAHLRSYPRAGMILRACSPPPGGGAAG
jgi:hypothetical protein